MKLEIPKREGTHKKWTKNKVLFVSVRTHWEADPWYLNVSESLLGTWEKLNFPGVFIQREFLDELLENEREALEQKIQDLSFDDQEVMKGEELRFLQDHVDSVNKRLEEETKNFLDAFSKGRAKECLLEALHQWEKCRGRSQGAKIKEVLKQFDAEDFSPRLETPKVRLILKNLKDLGREEFLGDCAGQEIVMQGHLEEQALLKKRIAMGLTVRLWDATLEATNALLDVKARTPEKKAKVMTQLLEKVNYVDSCNFLPVVSLCFMYNKVYQGKVLDRKTLIDLLCEIYGTIGDEVSKLRFPNKGALTRDRFLSHYYQLWLAQWEMEEVSV